MKTKRITSAIGLFTAIFLGLTGVVYAAGNIDTVNKWAWGTNIGWLNFNPAHGGVTVYSDHLEGYAWNENTGWIRLGTITGGSPHTYANDAANTYGVNNDGCGNLSGSAWGTNVGWIDFDDANGGVTIDPVTGEFDGYAWGENIGWVHFKNTSGNAYNVAASSMGNLAYHQTDTAAIITSRNPGPASSSGLIIADSAFLNDSGDCIVFGHNSATFANVTTNLASSRADERWARIWELDVHDSAGTANGIVTLTFDISDAGGTGSFDAAGVYILLKRAAGSSADFTAVTVVSTSVFGDQITFEVDASNLGLSAISTTVGVTNQAPTADAGADQPVDVGAAVTLDGTGSSDPDGHTPLTYAWTQTGGISVTLSSSSAVSPTFTAPSTPSWLTFSLVVTDALGLAAAASDVVIVTVNDITIAGLTASSDSPTGLGSATNFTAIVSTGSNVTYAWDFGDGTGEGTGANPTYTYATVGNYTATVTATNGSGSTTATTQVVVEEGVVKLYLPFTLR